MNIIRRLLAIVGIAIVVLAGVVLAFLARGGAFRTITPHFAGRCEALPLQGSGEDIVVDHERGIAYLSVLDRRSVVKGIDVQGTVLKVDLASRPWAALPALDAVPAQFRPHGMSLYVGPEGGRRLFVINHGPRRGVDPEAVELFRETSAGMFAHEETFTSPLMISPNDLAAVGPRQFYVANDKALGGRLAAGLQQIGIGASPLTWFDGADARNVLTDIASGGGVNTSADHGRLFVSETAGKRIRVLERDASGALTERARIPIDTAPDNIDVAADGSIWVTGHANTLALIRHFVSGSPAPTQVWRVVAGAEGGNGIEEIYLDDGRQMSAGSVGTTHGKLLLIGSITERKIQICEMGS